MSDPLPPSAAALPIHEPARQRFLLPAVPEPALLEYALADGVMTIHRTFVPESLRGGGVAGVLTRAALAWARAEGLTVEPACGYVDVFLRRHAEWADLRRE
jgi:uncharacterized protein